MNPRDPDGAVSSVPQRPVRHPSRTRTARPGARAKERAITTASGPKRLILNLFEMSCVSHITHGLWRLPGNNRHRYSQMGYWTELARICEDGGFDAVFLADVVGAYDVFRGGPADALREGLQIPNNDPMLMVPAMAAVTEHLGFGVTFSTSYEPPFAFARRMSTLDHLTAGRIGWNIVTSYLPNAARNFGLDDQIPHDTRFAIAEEYLDVLYKLWEGSWDDDAVIRDAAGAVYTDPTKVRYIDHEGPNFRVAGPHLSEPSPQRTPVLFQATASPAGIAQAARHAEVVFTGAFGGSIAPLIERFRTATADGGRQPDDLKIIVQAGVVVGRTDAEVERKLAEYRAHSSTVGRFVHASLPFDPTAHPREITIREALAREGVPEDAVRTPLLDRTVGAFVDDAARPFERDFFTAGTPTKVADDIERWLDHDGIDGINLRQYHSYDTARDFADLVVPELRRRGRLRESYVPGETLRARLTGRGDRLPDTHPAAAYRGGRGLGRHRADSAERARPELEESLR